MGEAGGKGGRPGIPHSRPQPRLNPDTQRSAQDVYLWGRSPSGRERAQQPVERRQGQEWHLCQSRVL